MACLKELKNNQEAMLLR